MAAAVGGGTAVLRAVLVAERRESVLAPRVAAAVLRQLYVHVVPRRPTPRRLDRAWRAKGYITAARHGWLPCSLGPQAASRVLLTHWRLQTKAPSAVYVGWAPGRPCRLALASERRQALLSSSAGGPEHGGRASAAVGWPQRRRREAGAPPCGGTSHGARRGLERVEQDLHRRCRRVEAQPACEHRGRARLLHGPAADSRLKALVDLCPPAEWVMVDPNRATRIGTWGQ